jgi:hypothetical protein
LGKHKIWCYFWRFWLKGLQIAAVVLADGVRDGDANGAKKWSDALRLNGATLAEADAAEERTLKEIARDRWAGKVVRFSGKLP